jgi:hypothetical protein
MSEGFASGFLGNIHGRDHTPIEKFILSYYHRFYLCPKNSENTHHAKYDLSLLLMDYLNDICN